MSAAKKFSEADELKMIYQEIIEGCSYCPRGFFIKHLCELEQIEITRKRFEFISEYVAQGVPTEEDRLKHVIESGEWGEDKEGDILAYRQTIIDNEKLVSTIIAQQQPMIRKVIEANRQSLVELLATKRMLIGTTAEELANKDSTYFLAYLSLYADRKCSKRLFNTWEDFENLEEKEQSQYLDALDETMSKLKELTVRKISALPFFLNPFSYSKESIHTFLNKPICELTNYQVHLFSLGTRNLSILSQSDGNPPEYFEKTPAEEVIKWYDQQYSIILGKRNKAH